MKTFILPGFSFKNKIWVDEIASKLPSDLEPQAVNWSHWNSNLVQNSWIEIEAQKIVDASESKKINIIAKSVGTIVSMVIIKNNPEIINKIILCGIPINDFQIGDSERYQILKKIPPENILCIQNENDNHGNFNKANELIQSINPNVNIVSKPRDDHEYPYYQDFLDYLSN